MKRIDYWINQEYNGLPQYSFINIIDPYYLPKHFLEENTLYSGYLVCYTAKGLMQIPEEFIEAAI